MRIVKDDIAEYIYSPSNPSNQINDLCSIISWILDNCGITMTDCIKTHWEKNCGSKATNPPFWVWLESQYDSFGKIHQDINICDIPQNIKNGIQSKFTPRKDLFNTHYFKCAYSVSQPRYLLTDDFSHFSTDGTLTTKTRNQIKNNNTSNYQRYLESNLNFKIGSPKSFALDFNMTIKCNKTSPPLCYPKCSC
jgi:hypothetical protein